MAFTTWLPKVRYHREHFNERTWMCYHQIPPLVRVVAHVGDAGQAKPHLEHNPLSLLGTCHAMPLRKLNDPAGHGARLDGKEHKELVLTQGRHARPFVEFQAHRARVSVEARMPGLDPRVDGFRAVCEAQGLTPRRASGL